MRQIICSFYAFSVPLQSEMAQEKILITGASGFIGSFIVEEALARGMEVWAAVRGTSSLVYLQDPRINRIELNLADEGQMRSALRGMAFDYVVHAAGATKARSKADFFRINTDGTRNLVSAVEATSPALRRLVLISSLSVMGAVRERMPYTEIVDCDTPQPNTAYAESKLRAEEWLRANATVPYTILRPTGVYGPREKDYMLMADSIRKGEHVAAGYKRQDLTFVFMKDVASAVFQSMKSAKTVGKAYFLSDGSVYTSRDFSVLILAQLGRKLLLRLTLPLWVLRAVCAASDLMTRVTGKLSTLNNDHYNILKQRNWRCDIMPARRDFGYAPQWPLHLGVREMLR